MLLRRRLEEQADLQQALELQSRRLMGLKLLEMKHHHHRALSAGSPIPSPTHSYSFFNQSTPFSPLHSSTRVLQGTMMIMIVASCLPFLCFEVMINLLVSVHLMQRGKHLLLFPVWSPLPIKTMEEAGWLVIYKIGN